MVGLSARETQRHRLSKPPRVLMATMNPARLKDLERETGFVTSFDQPSPRKKLKAPRLEVPPPIRAPVSKSQVWQLGLNSRPILTNIFSRNVVKSSSGTVYPEPGARIDTTPQLALCSSVLVQNTALSLHSELGSQIDVGQIRRATDNAHHNWVKRVSEDPVEQQRIRWLLTSVVEEFVKDVANGSAVINEAVFLAPALDREHYRN